MCVTFARKRTNLSVMKTTKEYIFVKIDQMCSIFFRVTMRPIDPYYGSFIYYILAQFALRKPRTIFQAPFFCQKDKFQSK